MNDLQQFLDYNHLVLQAENENLHDLQIGKKIQYLSESDDWEKADIIIVGCGERRGSLNTQSWSNAADAIRKAFYKMYYWHDKINITDIGNVLEGNTINDTKAALKTILKEIHDAGKIAIVLGGSQDLTLTQYEPFKNKKQLIDMAVIDSLIDMEDTENIDDRNYLMELLTSQPNFIRHFSQIGFQSYFVNPSLLQTLDKLGFDCYRLGRVREDLEEMEPVLRNCEMVSIDMNVMRYSEALFLSNHASPNGLFGDEICQLTRYAGMSQKIQSLGIYGYDVENDEKGQGAQLIAQMLWYFMDGLLVAKREANIKETKDFIEFNVTLDEFVITFYKSLKTNRWWMQSMNGDWIPCSYQDYLIATNNEIPNRWFRAQERIF